MKRIVSTRVRVARNLGPPFVMNPNGNAETRNAVLDLVREVVATLDEELTGTLYEHAKLTKEEEQRLIDEHFLFKGRDMRQAACGYHQVSRIYYNLVAYCYSIYVLLYCLESTYTCKYLNILKTSPSMLVHT